MDRLYAEIGGRMRSLRASLRLTQARVAEAAGIDTSFYGQIERGANIPSLKTFLAIAEALGAEPAELLPRRGALPARPTRPPRDSALDRLVSGLGSGKRALLLGIVSDVVDRLKR